MARDARRQPLVYLPFEALALRRRSARPRARAGAGADGPRLRLQPRAIHPLDRARARGARARRRSSRSTSAASSRPSTRSSDQLDAARCAAILEATGQEPQWCSSATAWAGWSRAPGWRARQRGAWRELVTIASPHHGTALAHSGPGRERAADAPRQRVPARAARPRGRARARCAPSPRSTRCTTTWWRRRTRAGCPGRRTSRSPAGPRRHPRRRASAPAGARGAAPGRRSRGALGQLGRGQGFGEATLPDPGARTSMRASRPASSDRPGNGTFATLGRGSFPLRKGSPRRSPRHREWKRPGLR